MSVYEYSRTRKPELYMEVKSVRPIELLHKLDELTPIH